MSAQGSKIPLGIEMYSVRGALTKDLVGTTTAVAKMGYQVLEYYSPYYSWTLEQVKDVRKLLDDLGVKCLSTHNGAANLMPAGIQKAIEYNQILGSKTIVSASPGPGRVVTLDDYKAMSDRFTEAAATLKAVGMRAGYHNHANEFKMVEGKRPIDIIAANTPADFTMQFDVGTCVEVGEDPVAYIKANAGRVRSAHLKDWGKTGGFQVLFGEGDVPWMEVFKAAESVGGIEYYIMEQEGSRFPEFETAERCIANYKKMRA